MQPVLGCSSQHPVCIISFNMYKHRDHTPAAPRRMVQRWIVVQSEILSEPDQYGSLLLPDARNISAGKFQQALHIHLGIEGQLNMLSGRQNVSMDMSVQLDKRLKPNFFFVGGVALDGGE
eukprot:765386-Hanusia_phi.AAC.12